MCELDWNGNGIGSSTHCGPRCDSSARWKDPFSRCAGTRGVQGRMMERKANWETDAAWRFHNATKYVRPDGDLEPG